MSVQLKYRHYVHMPEWTEMMWPAEDMEDLEDIIAAELAGDFAEDEDDELECGSIMDDIEIERLG